METRRRSIAKGLTWRALAMLDTVLLALIFTRSFTVAASIAGIELVTKVLWYYAHERLWLHVPAEHPNFPGLSRWLSHDRQMRGFLKAVSWRFFGALDTFLISLVITGKLVVSGSIGGTELFTKIILYYLHDRAWSHVWWGKAAHAASQGAQGPGLSRLRDFVTVLRRHYHLSAMTIYALACVAFIIVSATIIYSLHGAFTHVTTDALIHIGEPR